MAWSHVGTLNDSVISNTGNQAVAANATSQIVTSILATTTAYKVTISPNWNTGWWVSGKTLTQFQVNFNTPAPADGSGVLDWTVSP